MRDFFARLVSGGDAPGPESLLVLLQPADLTEALMGRAHQRVLDKNR